MDNKTTLIPGLPPAEVASIIEAQLRAEGALLSGHFKLSSGLHSDTYVQCARFLRKPDLAAPAMAELASRLRAAGLVPDTVVGPAMGGVVVSYELARQLGVPSLFTERDANGEMTLRRGFTLAPGERVVIAEDVVTTGKSTLEVARVLREMGVEVLAVASLIDRTNGAAQLPFPNFALLPVQAAVFAADAVPQHLAGIPAVKPGSRPDMQPHPLPPPLLGRGSQSYKSIEVKTGSILTNNACAISAPPPQGRGPGVGRPV